MGDIHININLKVPDAIEKIGKNCINKGIAFKKKLCTSIQNHINKDSLKSLSSTINSKTHNIIHNLKSKTKHLSTVASTLKEAGTKISNTIKDFFDKSPTIGEICNKIGIDHKTFLSYPRDFQIFLMSNLKDCCDESATDTINMLKDVLDAFEAYKHNKNTSVSDEETKAFLAGIKKDIEELRPESQKELNLYKELLLNKELFSNTKPTKTDKALAISKLFGGQEISSKKIQLIFSGKTVDVQTQNTPQKLLSGIPGDDKLLQYSSEFQEKTIDHASNLWRQNIYVNGQNTSFIRSGNTRGCEQPAKEILANALGLHYSQEEILNADNAKAPLILNFSNVQLMTLGKIADKDMPLKQMKIFESLAKQQQPIEVNYQGKKVYVKFEQPLLFNFPTNAQGLCKIIQHFTDSKEINDRNDASFKNLFGDFKEFGGKSSTMIKKDGHYSFNKGSILGEKLNNENLDTKTKEQILSLADQIIDIYSNNKHGIEKNPYALPSRVALLTNLLGYATSYGCKSGKDRTGTMAMELENLTAKVLSDNKPYDAYNLSVEEKQNLQSIYKSGDAIEIAKVNTGNVQNKLKIKQCHGLFKSNEERFGIDLSKDYDENLKILARDDHSIDTVSFNKETLKKIEENINANKLKDFSLKEKLSWITSNLELELKVTVLNDLRNDNNFIKEINNNTGLQKYIESAILAPCYKDFSNKNNFYDDKVYQGMPALNTSHYQNAQKLLSVYTDIASNEFKIQNQKNFETLKTTLRTIDNIDSVKKLMKFLNS